MRRLKSKKVFASCLITFGVGFLLVMIGGWFLIAPTSPFNRQKTLEIVCDWTRTADIPRSSDKLSLKTTGGMFTRGYLVEFEDTPSNISSWLARSGGPSTATIESDELGWVIYRYPAGGGAAFAEVAVSPSGKRVRIRTYWS